jgi:ABC-type nitrate/sulfonate/bicarbonate transport system substrate-binding protein
MEKGVLDFFVMFINFGRITRPGLLLIFLSLILMSSGFFACQTGLDLVNLGHTEGEVASSLYIADELGLFAAKGLNVALHSYPNGLASYNAMLQGKEDISAPSEYVIVDGALRHDKVHAISIIVKTDFVSIIGRKDHGIGNILDLAGKRIGLMRGTIAEYYLGRFLELHGVSINSVTLVSLSSPTQGVDEVENGVMDAVVITSPYTDFIRNSLNANAIEWSVQNNQPHNGILTAKDDWLYQHSDLAVRLLKGIDQADTYIIEHPHEAKAIIQTRLNLDSGEVDKIWQRNSFSLSLDQSLITAMQDEAQRVINNGLTVEKEMPNFNNYIYEDAIKAIKPNAVDILR